MAQQILVIEYEPRYIQRIEEAAAGSGLTTTVARTGDEAIQALPRRKYDLIVLSTIIPRYSTAQLIRSVRSDADNGSTPILLTTSGYSGHDPRSDAVKLGASDMLIKPYAPADFVQKVGVILNLAPRARDASTEETVRVSTAELFGDLVDKPPPREIERTEVDRTVAAEPDRTVPLPRPSSLSEPEPVEPPQEKRRRTESDDVDQLLADTLAGVRLPSYKKKRKTTSAEDVDKLLETTLSGLETPKPKEARVEPRAEESVAGELPSQGPAEVEPTAPLPQEVSSEEPPFAESVEPLEPEPEPEPDLPPFDLGEEAAETGGTTLIRGEEPPHAVGRVVAEPARDADASRFGQYVLLEKIATGGMAEVWKAKMRGLEGFEKIVAIKKILPHLSDNEEFIEMFVDEAKLAAQLNHNNIIHIYDLGKIDESWFIAMEYIDGYDLKSLLRRGGEVDEGLPIPLALFIGSKIASALDYAHRKKGFDDQELGLVHRDVSPQNVLISREGDIKLCDFGIAKAATKASHTQAGALKGKLQYMSPEQAWGRQIDHRSDIFAAAAVLFEMLAGRKLFSGDSELSVLDQVREARVPAPSSYRAEIPPEIDEIVLRALEKEPAARFQTAGEMARAIDSILYNYKPAPTSADLAFYVAALEDAEMARQAPEPEMIEQSAEVQPPEIAPDEAAPESAIPIGDAAIAVDSPEIAEEMPTSSAESDWAEAVPPADVAVPVPFEASTETGRKKSRKLPIAIALILILGLAAAGAVILLRPVEEPGAAQSDLSAGTGTASAPDQVLTPSTRIAEQTSDALTAEELAEEQLVSETAELREEDLALIDQAVRDRIESERRRLELDRERETAPSEPERQQRATSPPAVALPSAPRSGQSPGSPPTTSTIEEPAADRSAEPATTTAVPPTTTTSPATTTTSSPPASQPPARAPAPPTIKRGDLVEPGTPGLKDPEIISLKRIVYPPLARRNRVEGLVIIRALISEEGRVLEAEILRGVNQNVGLNEAALDMVRGGRFEPATVGSTAVRAWKTIPIPFKIE